MSDGKHGLPPRHRIRANDGMHGFKNVADVFGRSSGGGIQLEVTVFRRFGEFWLRVCCRQGLEELLVRSGDAIVEVVARCPEGIC